MVNSPNELLGVYCVSHLSELLSHCPLLQCRELAIVSTENIADDAGVPPDVLQVVSSIDCCPHLNCAQW